MSEEQLNKEADNWSFFEAKHSDTIHEIIRIAYKAGYRSRDKEVEEKDKEITRIKEELKEYLPGDCVQGWAEVKFCSIRNADGWRCKWCAD